MLYKVMHYHGKQEKTKHFYSDNMFYISLVIIIGDVTTFVLTSFQINLQVNDFLIWILAIIQTMVPYDYVYYPIL